MNLFAAKPKPDSVKLGRSFEAPVEIHYSSGSEKWWHAGRLWVADTRPIRERQFNPVLADPRNRIIVDSLGQKGATVEGVARGLTLPTPVVREVARALETADKEHVLRIYGMEELAKEEERVLVTIDQDLLAEAPSIPYSQTEKGARRQQWAMMSGMVILDVIFLVLMLALTSQSQAGAVTPGAVSGTLLQFGELVSFPTAMLALYVWMNRRTLVRDIYIQPCIENLSDTHTEAVYLVNSEKTPAVTYLVRLFHLEDVAVRELTEEIVRFQSDTIFNLMEDRQGLRGQLDASKDLGIERDNQRLDLEILHGGRSPGVGGMGWATLVLVIVVVAVVAGVAVYATMG
ncbi:MAG: hypothetical protein L3K07_03860 [Thermoplasmata archaeon]|nr:hypothetical protein [Thermoplasmata archaeon]